MSTPSPRFSLSAIAAALLAAGALVAPQLSQAQTLGGASGPAGDATKVEKCDAPKGTLAVVEPQDAVLQALAKTTPAEALVAGAEQQHGAQINAELNGMAFSRPPA